MILVDHEIEALIDSGELLVAPITKWEEQLQPASLDLILSNTFIGYRAEVISPSQPDHHCGTPAYASTGPIDTKDMANTLQPYTFFVSDGEPFRIAPGEFFLGTTREYVKIPDNLVGSVEGRSSVGRLGIAVHVTAGYIDPGFKGQITLELANHGNREVLLYPGTRICQLVLYRTASPARAPYGTEGKGSAYQGQEGPVASRLNIKNATP